MTRSTTTLAAAFVATALAFGPGTAEAHFQELIPSAPIVDESTGTAIDLSLTFTHPMDNGPAMDMGVPTRFGVMSGGEIEDLSTSLKAVKVDGKDAYTARYQVKAPGGYTFFVEPAPYWEAAEGKMIIHYTKVVVDAFGGEEGWADPVGLPVEIEPLTRPYGLWTGNVFQGIVRKNGEPVPFAEVEIEYRSEGKISAPADPFVTQVVRADPNGVFTYVMPRAGWWGFAALMDGDETMKNPEGADVEVELGGLIWVHTTDMK